MIDAISIVVENRIRLGLLLNDELIFLKIATGLLFRIIRIDDRAITIAVKESR